MRKQKRKKGEISANLRIEGVGAVRVILSLDERFTKRNTGPGRYEWLPTPVELERLEYEAEQRALLSEERAARREEAAANVEPRITIQNAPRAVVQAALHKAYKL